MNTANALIFPYQLRIFCVRWIDILRLSLILKDCFFGSTVHICSIPNVQVALHITSCFRDINSWILSIIKLRSPFLASLFHSPTLEVLECTCKSSGCSVTGRPNRTSPPLYVWYLRYRVSKRFWKIMRRSDASRGGTSATMGPSWKTNVLSFHSARYPSFLDLILVSN